ncbi:DUF3016 domain-containing protein (plasmid) [Methylobacterium sp. NMS12]|uniref:DUF3016 domain-containing protein n=1 Tax=Methylobacterium sp. NMS12 TaxID=3079766 RepID=UPI003F8805F4
MRGIAGMAAALSIAAALFSAAPAEAQVRVRYAPALGFTEAGSNLDPNLSFRGTLIELTRIFEFLGQLYLPAEERLDVTVLDLNIAGIQSRGGAIGAPRIVTGSTPPQIKISYTLYRGTTPIARGIDFITDPNFQLTQNPKFSSGRLYYERRILSDWFEERFKYRQGLKRVSDR